MKPVYQTITNAKNGNCLAAMVASLLDLSIEEVPNFVEAKDWFVAMQEFMFNHGYLYDRYLINGNRLDQPVEEKEKFEWFGAELPEHGSINGFYDAVVWSKNFPGECHAVVCDQHFNIAHDPSTIENSSRFPQADEIGYNGVIGVCLWKKI